MQRKAEWTKPAVGDLERLAEDNAQLPKLAIDAVARLEAGEDGEPLTAMARTGDLTDCHKVYLGVGASPSHRLVYRLLAGDRIEVVEVVAVEQRADGYVYQLASHRLGRLPAETKRAFDRVHQRVIATRGERRRRKEQR